MEAGYLPPPPPPPPQPNNILGPIEYLCGIFSASLVQPIDMTSASVRGTPDFGTSSMQTTTHATYRSAALCRRDTARHGVPNAESAFLRPRNIVRLRRRCGYQHSTSGQSARRRCPRPLWTERRAGSFSAIRKRTLRTSGATRLCPTLVLAVIVRNWVPSKLEQIWQPRPGERDACF